MEEWAGLIYNYKNYAYKFQISSNGVLKNIQTNNILKTHINHEGYFQVCTSISGRKDKRNFKIHKCVLESFSKRPIGKYIVNHIDGNKLNNNLINLEWVTYSENTLHAVKLGLCNKQRGWNSVCSKLSEDDVKFIKSHYIPYDKEYGTRGLGRKFNVAHSTIQDVLQCNTYNVE